jgi:hypothetical protein
MRKYFIFNGCNGLMPIGSLPTRTAKVKEDTHARSHSIRLASLVIPARKLEPDRATVAPTCQTTLFRHVRTYYPQHGGGAVDVGKIAKDANLTLLGLFVRWPSGWIRATTNSSSSRRWPAATSPPHGNEDPQRRHHHAIPGRAKADFPQIPLGLRNH